jgi:hypothetical protein
MAPRGRPPSTRTTTTTNRGGGGGGGGDGGGGPPGGAAPVNVPPPAHNPLRGYLTDVLQIPLVVANAVLEEGGFRTFPDLITIDDAQMLNIT